MLNNRLKKITAWHFVTITLTVLYILLAYKSAFSNRSLVPNLEPFPDTLYYSNPAWNLAHGHGFVMKAFDQTHKIITPPMYSLYLTPFFFFANDIRNFYIANLILGIISVVLFIHIIKTFSENKKLGWLIGLVVGIGYVTNYYIYSLPQLLMAENITIPVLLLVIYVLVTPVTKIKSITAGIVGAFMLLIKFSNFPFTLVLYGCYLYKLAFEKGSKKYANTFIVSSILGGITFLLYIVKSRILVGHINLSGSTGFSTGYFLNNFSEYIKLTTGKEGKLLWYTITLQTPIWMYLGLIGILVGIGTNHHRKHTIMLTMLGLSVLVFMSFFFAVDSRYAMLVLILFLIFSSFLFLRIYEVYNAKVVIILLMLVMGVQLIVKGVGQVDNEREALTLRKQIALNFKYAETPWHFITIQQFNSLLDKTDPQKTYIATFLPSYYVSYFANGHYGYLPISSTEGFIEGKYDILHTYKSLLSGGSRIYITPYYENNIAEWKSAFEKIEASFNLILIKHGCFNACNIYRIDLKNN